MDLTKLNYDDWAGMLFSLLALIISLATLYRGISSERRAREEHAKVEKLRLSLKGQNALSLALNAELALLRVKAKYQEWWDRALSAGDPDIMDMAQAAVLSLTKQLSSLEKAKLELQKAVPEGPDAEEVEAALDEWFNRIGDLATPGLVDAREQETFNLFEQTAKTWEEGVRTAD